MSIRFLYSGISSEEFEITPKADICKMSDIPVVVFASARSNGDTRVVINKVFSKIDHRLVDLLEYNIEPYNYSGKYSVSDDYLKLMNVLIEHRKVVFATPVYWYAMSGLMKTFFDRFTDLVTVNKAQGRMLEGKFTYLLAVGAEERLPPGFEIPFQLTSDYLDMTYKGCLYHSTKPGPEENISTSVKSFTDLIQCVRT